MKWNRRIVLFAVGVLLIAAAMSVEVSVDLDEEPWQLALRSEHPLLGEPLPLFSMREFLQPRFERDVAPEYAPTERTAADYAGSVLVINLWASWCTGCRIEHLALVDQARQYRSKGVQFLGVVHEDRAANIARYLQSTGRVPYPVLLGGNIELGDAIGIRTLPQTFIVDREGIVRVWFRGIVSGEALSMVLDSVLATPPARRR